MHIGRVLHGELGMCVYMSRLYRIICDSQADDDRSLINLIYFTLILHDSWSAWYLFLVQVAIIFSWNFETYLFQNTTN